MSAPDIRVITSVSNPLIKDIRALFDRKGRKETGLFLVEGLRHVLEGIKHGWVLKTLVMHERAEKKPELERARQACFEVRGTCLEVSDAVLEKLSRKDNPQQVLGVFVQRHMKPSAIVSDMAGKRCIVALEQVRDPGNLGTILRTVDGVGANGVILIDQCCDPYSVECTRATMGSLFSVPIAFATQAEFLGIMQAWQGSVVGTHLGDRTVDYRTINYPQPLLLLMGNEQAGLSATLADACPTLVKLPMHGSADSLNLAVATGIMLYAALEEIK